ncbi:MAG: nucleotidyltransferase domain-containing protein [Synergistetes bacterium]|nr:nucleotidyltransferase domain-containing protein [Synergistota bacterium]
MKAFSINRYDLLNRLREISKELKTRFLYVEDVFLFGSFAREEERGLSDIDLLVVVKELSKENFWKIFSELYDFISEKLDIAFDLIVISKESFEQNPNKFGKILRI